MKIGDFVEEYGDGIHGTPKYSSKGKYAFINGNNLDNGQIVISDDTLRIDEDEYNKIKRPLSDKTILISINGTLGKIAFYNGEKVALGKSACYINLKDINYKSFMRYVMSTDAFQRYIYRVATGSTIKNLAPSQIIDYEFNMPAYALKIGEILSNIDRKIALNNSICADLEAMAKQIYDYWFVQFDFPDENGNPYKSSGGKMVWNEELNREIPEGWRITNVGSITKCHDAKRVPLSNKERDTMKGDIPYYGATGIMDYVNNFIFSGDYVLLAEDGSVMTEDGRPIIQRITGNVWVNNHTHVLEPINDYSCKLLMLILYNIPVIQIKTGSIQAKINQENLNRYKVVEIPNHLIKEINAYLVVIDTKILSLHKENEDLIKLRDFLLPLLMNGQVSVE